MAKESKKDSKKDTKTASPKKAKGSPKTTAKKNKFAGVKKGDKPNMMTAFAGLDFNVSQTKKWLKAHYESKNMPFQSVHYVLAATNEVVCRYVLSGLIAMAKQTKGGLHDIDFDKFRMYCAITPEINNSFSGFLHKYDDAVNYTTQLVVSKNDLSSYVEKVFHNNTDVNLNHDTLNYLAFILSQMSVAIADNAQIIASSLSKKSVTMNITVAAIRIVLKDKLRDTVMKKVDNVVKTVSQKKGKDDDDDDDEKDKEQKDNKDDGDDDDDDSDDEDTKKKAKSKSKKEESDDESDGEDSDDDKKKKATKKTKSPKKPSKSKN
uniref:Uncharacterized protein n=1 Tax=viral metagenome TaxID=1070528 RepID=A0A6C0EGE0_9ZZZZ